jgi:AraC-like DNA-binding protein
MALMRAAKVLANDDALALHFGETYAIDELSVVGLIGAASATLAEAFVQVNRYAKLVVEVDGQRDRLVLQRDGSELWIVDTRDNPNAFPEMTESSFARMVCTARRFGRADLVKAVHVTHPAPAWRAEYDRIFQVPVTFESDKNALLTDPSWMELKPAAPSRYVFGVLSERAEALLKELEEAKSVRGRVERLLMPLLHTGNIGMETIANRMAFSRQTLFRRLKEEGVTYEKVLDNLRRRLALSYLNEKNISVNETAYLVGFSDATAFSRAFKRWTGTSPRNARARDARE